jgi:ABC-type sugar transport system permease subunit
MTISSASGSSRAAGGGLPAARRRGRSGHQRWLAFAFMAPALVALVAIFIYPLGYSFWLSLLRWNLISGAKRWTGIGNYLQILSDPSLLVTIRVTLVYSGLSVLLEMSLGLALAVLIRAGLRRRLAGFPAMRVLIMAPLLVAPLLWAFYFRSFFSPQFGLFNQALEAVGLPPVLWVNTSDLALYSLVLADVWQWTPFVFSILLAGLLSLPGDVVEAARMDGAGGWAVFRLIELPMLRPVLLVALIMRTIDSLRYLDLVLVITQGGPGTSTEILNYLAYRTSFQEFQIGKGAAYAFIVFAMVLLAAIVLLRMMWKSAHAR